MRAVRTSSAGRRVFPALCLLPLFTASRAAAQNAAAPLPPEKVRQVEALIAAEMARQKIPGMSAAVVVGGGCAGLPVTG